MQYFAQADASQADASQAAERWAPTEASNADAQWGWDDRGANDGCGENWGGDHVSDDWGDRGGQHYARDCDAVVNKAGANGVRWQHDGGGW